MQHTWAITNRILRLPVSAAFYEQILEMDAKVMKQWDSRRCSDSEETNDTKYGPSCKLPLVV